jgi:hypothetical protein
MSGNQNPVNANNFASLPNSRNSSRTSTKVADTYCFLALFPTGGGAFDPSLVEPVFGDIGVETVNGNTILAPKNRTRTYLILRNVDSAETIKYGYEDRADLATTGMTLRAGEPVEIDSKQVLYVRSIATDSSDVECCVDFGLG